MASVKTILSEVGHALEVFFKDATEVAAIAEPIVDIAFPGIATLYNFTVTAAMNAENAAIAAGNQSGTATQKLAFVVASIETAYNTYAAANKIPVTPAAVAAWANAVVATLNAIPSPGAPVTPTVAVAAPVNPTIPVTSSAYSQ